MHQQSILIHLLALLCVLALKPGVTQPTYAAPRTILVTGTIQSAVDRAVPGDILQLEARTYTEKVEIAAPGTPTAPLILKGAGQGQTILYGRVRILASALAWRLEDFDIHPTDSGDAIRIETPARDITIQRMQLSGGSGYGVRISNEVANVLFQDSSIHDFDAGASDAHGIGIMTASNITVRNCEIYNNSGDSIQVNTPDYPGYGRYATNILIENNRLYNNRENALDVKSTRGLVAHGNEMWGAHAVSSSDGMAVQIQYDAQNITISNNIIRDSDMGLEISRGKKNGTVYPIAPRNITIIGNLFRGIGAAASAPTAAPSLSATATFAVFLPIVGTPRTTSAGGAGGGSARATGNAIVVLTSADVKIYNNSVIDAQATALYVGESSQSGPPSALDIRNNMLDGRVSDLGAGIDYSAISSLTVDHNHYRTARIGGASLAAWIRLGYEQHATTGDPDLDTAFRPVAGSPLRDSGANLGFPFSGSAPDRGWGE